MIGCSNTFALFWPVPCSSTTDLIVVNAGARLPMKRIHCGIDGVHRLISWVGQMTTIARLLVRIVRDEWRELPTIRHTVIGAPPRPKRRSGPMAEVARTLAKEDAPEDAPAAPLLQKKSSGSRQMRLRRSPAQLHWLRRATRNGSGVA
jgi:hypothetical protein